MSVGIDTSVGKGFLVIDLAGAASTANAGIGQVANPEGVDLLITRSYIHFQDGSIGAANLDVGIGASGEKGTDILSTFAVADGTVGGKAYYCQAVPVNETEEAVIWGAAEYLTATGSATTVGMLARLYLEYIRLG